MTEEREQLMCMYQNLSKKVHTYHVLSCLPSPYVSSSPGLYVSLFLFLTLQDLKERIYNIIFLGLPTWKLTQILLCLLINYLFLKLIKTHMYQFRVDENLTVMKYFDWVGIIITSFFCWVMIYHVSIYKLFSPSIEGDLDPFSPSILKLWQKSFVFKSWSHSVIKSRRGSTFAVILIFFFNKFQNSSSQK